MNATEINKGWRVHKAGEKKEYVADIPAMVADILYKSGDMPDPYYRENEWSTYELLKNDYEFANEFTVTEEQLAADRLTLCFEGVDTAADIYLNDGLLASVNNMHRSWRFDIKALARVGENRLRIYFRSNILYAEALHEADPYYVTSDTVNGFSMVRKAHSTYGWDWGPKLPDMGLWRGVTVEAYSAAAIADLYLRQKHDNGVELTAELELELFGDAAALTAGLTVTAPDGTSTVLTVPVSAGKNSLTVTVENPQLWWCNGFGEQPLYKVAVSLYNGEALLDSRTLEVGLRTLTMRREKDEWGESFEFCLNGVSIFAMGANYIPEDSLYPRCTPERSEQLIKQCVAANYNCLRVWGGGYFCDDWFYSQCDRHGLIVWQDLLFACGVYKLKEGFVENVVAETRDNVRRLRHHACIALWCGNNELEWGWSGWDMGFGNSPYDRADYIKLFEWILPETVRSLDPDRFYWLASPSSGGSFDDPNDQNRGDVHYWEVWHRLKPFTEYRKYHFRFCSEFGFQSFPCEKTVDSFALPEDKNIFSPVMENHQKNGSANGRILLYLADNFRYPTDFKTLLYASQVLQAEAIKYGVEHWRSNRGRCMGSLYWQLNDCWPVASWASLDYFNRWKPLHYYAKRFYAPVLLAALEEKGAVRFVVSNETMSAADCRIVWRLRSNDGELLEEREATRTIAPLTALECASADYSAVASDRALSRSRYLEYSLYQNGAKVSGSTLLFTKPKHFDFVDPKLSYTVSEDEEAYMLDFTTDSYAKYVTVDSDEFDFVADDNCFDLSSGETKRVTIKKSDISGGFAPEMLRRLTVVSAFDIG